MTLLDETPPANIEVDLADPTDTDGTPGVALEHVPAGHTSYLPAPGEWAAICQMADVLATSDLVPKSYRGKPANVVLATLAGRPHGWDPTMAMRSFHVIEGQPSMKPEVMLALVRQAGHSVAGVASAQGSKITGTRCDNGDTLTVEFTVADAVRAKLCQLKDGQPFARSSTGKVLPWEQYPEDMCWARTLSKLCRRLFPDVVLGAGYVPEELGYEVTDSGDLIELDSVELPAFVQRSREPETITVEESSRLRDRASALPDPAKQELRSWAQGHDGGHLRFSDFTPGWAKRVTAFIASLEKRAENGEWGSWPEAGHAPGLSAVVDAEVVCNTCSELEDQCVCGVDHTAGPDAGPVSDVMDSATLAMVLKLPDDGLAAIGLDELRGACRAASVQFDDDCDEVDLVLLLRAGTDPF